LAPILQNTLKFGTRCVQHPLQLLIYNFCWLLYTEGCVQRVKLISVSGNNRDQQDMSKTLLW